MIYSNNPVDMQKSYESALRASRKTAEYPYGDGQARELGKAAMELANLNAANYNMLLKLNEQVGNLTRRLDMMA